MGATDERAELNLGARFIAREGVLRWLREGLGTLPTGARPTHFGIAERPRRTVENEISRHDDYRRFLDDAGDNCFLYGPSFKIYTSVFDDRSSSVSLVCHKDRHELIANACDILKSWSDFGAIYGYGCEFSEFIDRHEYAIELCEGGRSLGWCGRDFTRYVPGLYWLNYFSNLYCNKMSIDVECLRRALDARLLEYRGGVILQLYEHPRDWPKHAHRVRKVIDETQAFFSKRRVPVAPALPMREVNDWWSAIAREWP